MFDAGCGGQEEQADRKHVGKMPVVKGSAGELKEAVAQDSDQEWDQIMLPMAVNAQQDRERHDVKQHQQDPA